MITGESLTSILDMMEEGSIMSVRAGTAGDYVPSTLQDLGIEGESLVPFATGVAQSLAVAGAEQDSGLIEIIASALVLGVQLGVYAEREQANE